MDQINSSHFQFSFVIWIYFYKFCHVAAAAAA